VIRAAVLLFLTIGATVAQDAATAGKSTGSPSEQEQVDRVFARWDSPSSPGCALSVMKDGRVMYKRGYGVADLDHDIPITPETVFHVASISKQFTAMAILLLAQEEKLSLDDDVRKYISELPDFGVPITIRHLIYHTSGLRDQWALLDLAGWRYSLDLITDDDVLQLMSRQKELNFKPGEKSLYSNTGYTLLAQIVKRVSGQSFREFTTDRIFRPLDMKSTHFRDDHAEIVKHIAYGYVPGEGGKGYRLSVPNFDTVGPTSLLTTVEDLAKWDENFYHPRVGGQALVKQQLQRGKLNSGKELDYAFGLGLYKYRGLPTVEHGGADAGYRAALIRFPDQHFSVACLCNSGDVSPGELAQRVADIYLAGQFKEPAAARPGPSAKGVIVSPQRLAQYAGLYWKKDDETFRRFALKDGKLFMGALELMALSDNRFQLVADPDEMYRFDQASSGAPLRVTFRAPALEVPLVFERVAELRLTPTQLGAYAGSYVSEEIDPVFKIVIEAGGLALQRLKSKPEKLGPLVEDYFEGLNGVIHFQRDAEGRITGFVLNTERILNFHFRKTAQM
jgi:CubicO group peptidase (beta-lactamase class C family)